MRQSSQVINTKFIYNTADYNLFHYGINQRMGITKILSEIFDLKNIKYQIIEDSMSEISLDSWSSSSVKFSNLANITLFKNDKSIILAIFPSNHHLQIEKLSTILNQVISYLTISEIRDLLKQFEKDNINDILSNHKIKVVIDLEISDQDTILFKNKSEKHFISVDSDALENLIIETPIGCQFSEAKPEFIYQPNMTPGTPRLNLANKINNIDTLPILPEIAAQILQLQNNENASVELLTDIVSQDPSLTSLILKYANSALFGQRGSVDSVYDAILRVMGFDTVLYLAIGLAMGNTFKLDKQGALGSKNIWGHAVYCASICQKLSQSFPAEFRPNPGHAYLAGLLHDIGFLVLASSFETEYFWLNKLISSKPDVPMSVIEHQLLGIHHTELGCILLKNWNMPEFLYTTVAEHHNEDYLGRFCELSGLVLLVDRALKSRSRSDAFTDVLPEELISRLGLTKETIYECIDEVLECSDSLDIMVTTMSA